MSRIATHLFRLLYGIGDFLSHRWRLSRGNSAHFILGESFLDWIQEYSGGVKGIRLKKDDEVSSFNVLDSDKEMNLLVVMANGYAKQTPLKDYKVQNRGGSGILTAKVTDKTGHLVSSHAIIDQTELLAISTRGQILKTTVKSIRKAGRATQGVRIMKLDKGDELVGTVCL